MRIMSKLRIKLVRSRFGRIPRHRATLKALGLKKIGQVRELPDRPEIRGMVDSVGYLLEVEEVK